MTTNSYILTSDGELYHYGVLGMKWGIRKARQRGDSYTYKSFGQRQLDRKLNRYDNTIETNKSKITNAKAAKNTKYAEKAEAKIRKTEAKIDKTKTKLQDFKIRDSARQRYVEKTNVGSAIARDLLLGGFGTGTYTRLRSSGYRRTISVGLAFMTNVMPIYGVTVSKMMENDVARNRNGGI